MTRERRGIGGPPVPAQLVDRGGAARRPRRGCPALAGEVTADVCVVGGGFAGLWTAYELHERDPGLAVVLIEADIVGAGGSGANGGLLAVVDQLSSLCASLGEEGGVEYTAALADMVDELDGWIARHDARIDAWHEGILYARAGTGSPVRTRRPSACSSRTGTPTGGGGRRGEAREVADSPRFMAASPRRT